MLIYRLKNFQEYQQHRVKQKEVLERRRSELMQFEIANRDSNFTVEGFSITAEQNVKFIVDWHYSYENRINWRERIVCPITGLNNRQRASYHLFLSELEPYEDDRIYITEQVTQFHAFLDKKILNLIGSEYVDSGLPSGYVTDNDVRHEDLTALSFQDESLDKLISFDCLEHIADYKSALKECYRVIKPGGSMLASFPFNKNEYETLIRAKVLPDGTISHLCEPEYHGDPLSDDGCLSFYTFGWELLEDLRAFGFSEVYAVIYWSDVFGYLGDEQIAFVAKR